MEKHKPILAHEELGLTELAYNLAFGQGLRHARGQECGYRKGTALRKAFERGRRAKNRGSW